MGKKINGDVMTDDDDDKKEGVITDSEEGDHEDDDHDEHEEHEDGERGKDDERLVQSDDSEESEAEVLERRRKERQERKKRREEAIRRDKTELKFLRQQNDALERRLMNVEVTQHQGVVRQVDESLTKAQQDLRLAEEVLAKAMKANNSEDVVKAMRFRDEAQKRIDHFKVVKEQATRVEAQPRASTVDERTKQHAMKFLADHSWYSPRGADEDSTIVRAIDSALVNEGYDPTSDEYWKELRNRVKRRLPERFSSDNDDDDSGGGRRDTNSAGRDRGPRMGSGRSTGSTSRQQFVVTPERKAAMIEAGVWDDPKLRSRYIKRYAEYDAQHKQNRA